MKGTNLGEFEELVLLIVANLDHNAYGLMIKDEIKRLCDRSVSLSTVHSTLHRLEKKEFLSSKYDKGNESERGGRPKLLFRVSKSGQQVLTLSRELRNNLWSGITGEVFG